MLLPARLHSAVEQAIRRLDRSIGGHQYIDMVGPGDRDHAIAGANLAGRVIDFGLGHAWVAFERRNCSVFGHLLVRGCVGWDAERKNVRAGNACLPVI